MGGDQQEPVPDFRQQLASDRTLLAWLRTSISMAGLGFVVARFGLFLRHLEGATQVHTDYASRAIGVTLVGLSAVVLIVGIAQHQFVGRVLSRHHEVFPGPRWPVILAAVAGLVAIISLAVYLLTGASA
ncbi:MAG: DUF202 domain-containing protein [Mycobacterium sp.]